METTQVSINMNKQNLVYTYNGILSHKNNEVLICYNWMNPKNILTNQTQKDKYFMTTYMRYQNQADSQGQNKGCQGQGEGMGCHYLMRAEFLFGMITKS